MKKTGLTVCLFVGAVLLGACVSSDSVSVSEVNNSVLETEEVSPLEKAVEDMVNLSEDEEIESEGWVDEAHLLYRIKVQYKEPQEKEYQHKRDYFFFVDEKVVPLEVDYPSKFETDGNRYVWDACDFEVKFEDVTFDGKEDLLISLGYSGAQGNEIWCAYAFDGEKFTYIKSFEEIPDYWVDSENRVICGSSRDGYASYILFTYSFDSDKNDCVLVNEERISAEDESDL